jgi:hypothetical protein
MYYVMRGSNVRSCLESRSYREFGTLNAAIENAAPGNMIYSPVHSGVLDIWAYTHSGEVNWNTPE